MIPSASQSLISSQTEMWGSYKLLSSSSFHGNCNNKNIVDAIFNHTRFKIADVLTYWPLKRRSRRFNTHPDYGKISFFLLLFLFLNKTKILYAMNEGPESARPGAGAFTKTIRNGLIFSSDLFVCITSRQIYVYVKPNLFLSGWRNERARCAAK